MNDRVVAFSAPGHAAVEPLLPWLINGTLEGDERIQVERHVGRCRVCQRELESLRQVQALCISPDVSSDADRALAKLAPRLSHRPSTVQAAAHGRRWRATSALGLAATVALAVALGVFVRTGAPPAPAYRTLGAEIHAPASTGSIVVRFAAVPGPAELATVARATGARHVAGPNGMGAFVMDVDAARQADALAYLRGRPDVVLAEGLDAAATSR
jgi:predicted RecB family endonuclease